MLFFKQIKDEKLSDQAFDRFYQRECHICATTIQVIAKLEQQKQEIETILRMADVSADAYEALKKADVCDPKQVRKLCRHLEIPTDDWEPQCPRRDKQK